MGCVTFAKFNRVLSSFTNRTLQELKIYWSIKPNPVVRNESTYLDVVGKLVHQFLTAEEGQDASVEMDTALFYRQLLYEDTAAVTVFGFTARAVEFPLQSAWLSSSLHKRAVEKAKRKLFRYATLDYKDGFGDPLYHQSLQSTKLRV